MFVALVLVLEPKELPEPIDPEPVEPEPMAPDELPMELPEPTAEEDPMEPAPDPMDELPVSELAAVGAGEVLSTGGVTTTRGTSSAFLPHAPKASNAAIATEVAIAGLNLDVNIGFSFENKRHD